MEMLRQVSRTSNPEHVVRDLALYLSDPRFGREGMINVSTLGLEPGKYRLIRTWFDFERPFEPSRFWTDPESLRVAQGGFVGSMIADGSPKILSDLDVRDDPIFGNDLAGFRSCVALPVLVDGQVAHWVFFLRQHSNAFVADDLEERLVVANLVVNAMRNLVTAQELARVNQALTMQFEQVARIQQALLPERIPPIPGLTIATSYLTSDQAGGDYYDFFPLADGRWGILIADVSGHGAGAATVMAMLHAILHAYPDLQRGPSAALRFANDRLCRSRMESSFVTALFAVYDPPARTLLYSRAGHPLPRIKDTISGSVRTLEGASGLPLGIAEDYDIDQATLRLAPGETVVFYTDGITEAFDKERRMFGPEGLDAALRVCSGEPDCVVDTVHTALYRHTGVRTRADDQTLVVFKVGAGDRA